MERKRERDVLYVRLSRSAESLIVFPERAALCLVLSLFSPTMRHLPLLRFILPLLSSSMQTAFQIVHNPPPHTHPCGLVWAGPGNDDVTRGMVLKHFLFPVGMLLSYGRTGWIKTCRSNAPSKKSCCVSNFMWCSE